MSISCYGRRDERVSANMQLAREAPRSKADERGNNGLKASVRVMGKADARLLNEASVYREQQQKISCRSMVLYERDEGTHRLFNLQAQADQFFRSRIIQGRFQGILLQMENGKIVELNATEKI
eukprot:scaffold12436_cov73-Skeletonema_marinoi.AAC.1